MTFWSQRLPARKALLVLGAGATLAAGVMVASSSLPARAATSGPCDIYSADGIANAATQNSFCSAPRAAHPVLDQAAIGEYRDRLKRLDAEINAADDPDQTAAARTERDWLLAQLTSATGLSGRTRSFSGQDERARVAVGKAIRRARARIAEADPVIGEHLNQTVRTGVRCSYWPG